ncbi:MAG: translation initiation factor IF-3 [candidate division WOR-3 bacterium]
MKPLRPRANEEITANFVRLIGANKQMIGIMPTKEALRMAKAQGLDLVEIAPNSEPPVCGIMNLGKYLYELKSKAKAAKKKQHTTNVREIRLSMKISDNDYQVKLNKIKEFLANKDRVRVSLMMRGRELLHKDLAMSVINRLIEDLKNYATLENPPKFSGETRQIIQVMFLPK